LKDQVLLEVEEGAPPVSEKNELKDGVLRGAEYYVKGIREE